MTESSKLTYKFLHMISSHLSGRADCRKLEYIVAIGVDDARIPRQLSLEDSDKIDHANYVYMYPEVLVFPGARNRNKNLKLSIVDHIIKSHMTEELYNGVDPFGRIKVETSKMVQGVYKYQISYSGRKRRWIRMK